MMWLPYNSCLMSLCLSLLHCINTLGPKQNGRQFADDIFNCIFFNENVLIQMKMSLKFVPKGAIYNIPALVQIMAWRRPGDKPLSETIMVRLPMHICITQPQWVNTLWRMQNGSHFTDSIINFIFLNESFMISIKISLKFVPKGQVSIKPELVQIMAWCRTWQQAIIWTNNDIVCWCIYVSLYLHGLTHWPLRHECDPNWVI